MIIHDIVYVHRLVGGERLAWHGRYHAHGPNEYELHYFLEGTGSFLANRAKLSVEGGRLFLSRPREFHSILPEAVARPITYYAILFEPEEGNPADAEALPLLESGAGIAAKSFFLEARERFFFEELHRLVQYRDDAGKRAASYQLLSLIHRWYGRREPADTVPPGKNDHVERALALMARSVREKLGSAELADKLRLSEEHFIRLFKEKMGMSPFQYFTRLKAQAASEFLTSGSLSVGTIADMFGFENQFHFSRVFKKCTGLSPTEYRRVYARAIPD